MQPRLCVYLLFVIPAKAGIQKRYNQNWIPAFAGMTPFLTG